MQYLLPVKANDRCRLSTKQTDKHFKSNFFNINPICAQVAVEYFMAISCLALIFYGHLNPAKICHICPLITSQYKIL